MTKSPHTIRHGLPSGLIHDLRTPLNQIIGYSEMLIEQAQEQGQNDFVPDLQKSHAAGQQLLSIINDNFHPISPLHTPLAPAPTKASQPTADSIPVNPVAADRPANVAPGFLLVVDDIEANRDVLSRRLKREGYAVATAENGKQALEMMRADTFDLVLLDIMMPEMDGYEVLRRLKADEGLQHIPVIMISALSELDSVVRCIQMGAEDYLPKPFNPILLKARIGACLEKKRARDRAAHLFSQLEDTHQRLQEFAAALHVRNSEMARWREAREADLAVARTTQRAIVGSALPGLDGWQVDALYTPLFEVGGDVYGWRQLDDGTWLFWLADATGHGVAAALFTSLVALLFNQASAVSRTAHGILTHVNAEFYSLLRGGSYMTAGCVVIDASGRLSFAGAGHPPLLIRRRSGVVETLLSPNTMMGIDPSAEMSETVTTLDSGDVALLFSDGLLSLKSKDKERFTIKIVTDSLSRLDGNADLLPRLVAQLEEQSDAESFDDDLAAIALFRNQTQK